MIIQRLQIFLANEKRGRGRPRKHNPLWKAEKIGDLVVNRFTADINGDPIDGRETRGAQSAKSAAQQAAIHAETGEIIRIADQQTNKMTYWKKIGGVTGVWQVDKNGRDI